MKENKYDDERFFQKYGEMYRSQNGLQGAGEWPRLRKMLPDFKNLRVLDLGCGYGWHCKYAADNGAAYVLGTDLSAKMLAKAQQINAAASVEYRCAAMEELDFDGNSFDVIISSLAFHYVRDFEPLISGISRWMKPGGRLVFSVEHPVFTAYGTQDWFYDENGKILHFPVDHYFYEGKRETVFLGEKVVKYHRTLTTYLNTLLNHGFMIREIVEPEPPEEMMGLPGMAEELRRPMMLLVSAEKKFAAVEV